MAATNKTQLKLRSLKVQGNSQRKPKHNHRKFQVNAEEEMSQFQLKYISVAICCCHFHSFIKFPSPF